MAVEIGRMVLEVSRMVVEIRVMKCRRWRHRGESSAGRLDAFVLEEDGWIVA